MLFNYTYVGNTLDACDTTHISYGHIRITNCLFDQTQRGQSTHKCYRKTEPPVLVTRNYSVMEQTSWLKC